VNAFAGTLDLLRLALRRDRILVPVWVVVFVAVATFSTAATVDLYPTVQSRVLVAQSANSSPSLVALYGRIHDPESLGALALWKMAGTGTAMVAVLALIVVVRHTRAEEEKGRLELVGAAAVGRLAALTAALVVAGIASVSLGLATGVGLVVAGLPAAGSLAFGLAWAAIGVVFAAVAAVTAQLTRSARAATGIAAATLAGAYILRAIGDTSALWWLSWLSPVGLAQQVRPYAGERWWVFLLLVCWTVGAIGGAYWLAARRDLGSGLFPDRVGPANAGPRLDSPLALAWRLQRGALTFWAAGFAVVGAVLGAVVSNVGDLLESPEAQRMIKLIGGEKGITDAFLAAELSIVGVVVSAYGVQAALRLRSEEIEDRAEPVLANAVSRVGWASGHLAVALAGVVALLVTAGLSLGVADALQTGDWSRVGPVLVGALVQFPAAAVLVGIVAAAFGLAPRAVAVGWAALVVFLLLGEIGPLLELDQRVMDLSPFTHVPRLPGGEVSAAPLVWLAALAGALIVAGLAGFRRRDVG
jgi:ABC-2 type transport system permease protein